MKNSHQPLVKSYFIEKNSLYWEKFVVVGILQLWPPKGIANILGWNMNSCQVDNWIQFEYSFVFIKLDIHIILYFIKYISRFKISLRFFFKKMDQKSIGKYL